MKIILEGNELNFKTTVANKLAEKLKYEVVKGSSFEQSQCTHDELLLKFKTMLYENDNVIFDRFIYSNLVYADLYEDFAILDDESVQCIENIMLNQNVTTFYLWASDKELEKRLAERGDEYVRADRLKSINDKYEKVLHKKNVYWVNTEIYNSDDIVEIILDLCKLTPVT